jgi:hypothetical protein
MLIRRLLRIQCDPGYNEPGTVQGIFDCMKKSLFLHLMIPVAGVFLMPGCVWENEEELYPEAGICDTTDVSFSIDIVPILANNCYSCHSNLNAPSFAGGLSFEDHPDAARYSERITGAINHNEGFLPMPRGGNKLDPCSINLVEAWSSAGAPDN